MQMSVDESGRSGRELQAPALGKLPPESLAKFVFINTGAVRKDVLIGPAVGEDAAVIKWPADKFLVFASDPVVGASRWAGRLLVRVNVNDIAAKGGEPAFMAVTLILPPSMGEAAVAAIMREIHEECLENGIAIVGGHTEFNDFYRHPVLSASLIGMADNVFRASDIEEGDAVFVSKHIGIEGMAILASDRPDLLRDFFSPEEIREMEGWMSMTSILDEARLLRGAASFMHDPTEGGFMGGIKEICALSGLSVDLSAEDVPLHRYTKRASEALGFDPLRLVASGSVIAVVPEEKAREVSKMFEGSSAGIFKVGSMMKNTGGGGVPQNCEEELWALLKRKRSLG
jgi:hydrogenase maturation factor